MYFSLNNIFLLNVFIQFVKFKFIVTSSVYLCLNFTAVHEQQ